MAERSGALVLGGGSEAKVQPLPLPLEPTKLRAHDTTVVHDNDDNDMDNDNLPLLSKDATPVAKHSNSSRVIVRVSTGAEWSLRRAHALGYIAFSALHFSLMSTCVKYASRRVTSHETVFWRTTIAWLLNFIMLRVERVDLRVEPKHRVVLLLRSIAGTLGINLQFYAMSKMVLTDAVVIIFTSPVLTFLMGALVLGEAVERIDFASGVISYAGVLFVTRPAFLFPEHAQSKDATTLAVLCALGGAFTQACAYTCMRKLHDVNFMVIIHYFLLLGICCSIVTLLTLQVPLQLSLPVDTLLALVGSGFFAFIGQIFLTKGFQREKAGIASVMRYFDVVFVLLWDTTILGEHVSGYSIFGGAIILLGAALIVVRRAHAKK